jgi:hypothetical protein
MVKRIKEEDMAGALEFENLRKDDPQLQICLEEHRARSAGKLRIGRGGNGVRVMVIKTADMADSSAMALRRPG